MNFIRNKTKTQIPVPLYPGLTAFDNPANKFKYLTFTLFHLEINRIMEHLTKKGEYKMLIKLLSSLIQWSRHFPARVFRCEQLGFVQIFIEPSLETIYLLMSWMRAAVLNSWKRWPCSDQCTSNYVMVSNSIYLFYI